MAQLLSTIIRAAVVAGMAVVRGTALSMPTATFGGIALALALAHDGISTAAVADSSPLTLWYDKPARQWGEANPIGNGRLGAMIFGGAERERIQINEDTLWFGEPHDYAHDGGRPLFHPRGRANLGSEVPLTPPAQSGKPWRPVMGQYFPHVFWTGKARSDRLLLF